MQAFYRKRKRWEQETTCNWTNLAVIASIPRRNLHLHLSPTSEQHLGNCRSHLQMYTNTSDQHRCNVRSENSEINDKDFSFPHLLPNCFDSISSPSGPNIHVVHIPKTKCEMKSSPIDLFTFNLPFILILFQTKFFSYWPKSMLLSGAIRKSLNKLLSLISFAQSLSWQPQNI